MADADVGSDLMRHSLTVFSSSNCPMILTPQVRTSSHVIAVRIYRSPEENSLLTDYALLQILGDETLLEEMKHSESTMDEYFHNPAMIEKLIRYILGGLFICRYILQEDLESVEEYNHYCYSRNAAILLCSSLSLSIGVLSDLHLFGLICTLIDKDHYSPQ